MSKPVSTTDIATAKAAKGKGTKANKPAKAARTAVVYTLKSKKTDGLAPQAQCIVKALAALKGKAERAALVAALVPKGGLKTRQTPGYILSFYRQTLVDNGNVAISA